MSDRYRRDPPKRYRRLNYLASKWHFCRNCTRWPEVVYEETGDVPADGRVCPECVDLYDAYNCLECG